MRLSQTSAITVIVLLLGLFSSSFGANPAVTVTAPNGGTLEVFNVQNITWTVVADTGIAYFEIWFSNDSTNWTKLDSISGNIASYPWTPQLPLDASCWLSVFAMDSLGQGGFDNTNSFGVGPDIEEFDFPDGTALISLPVIPNDAVDSVWQIIGDDLGHRYQLFGFEPNQGFFNADTMAHGKGYFIQFDEFVDPDQTTFDVTGLPVTADSVHIPLVWGWNVICTPFRAKVDLWNGATFWLNDTASYSYWEAADDLLIHPPVFSFTNWGHIIDDELDPWRAYWFLTIVPGMSVTVYPDPSGPSPAPGRDDGNDGISDWSIDFSASFNGFKDSARMGVLENASDGFDNHFDFAEPPAPPSDNNVSLYFAHDAWNSPAGTRYERDIRNPLAMGETDEWVLSVRPSQNGSVTLTWGDLARGADWRSSITLIDGENTIDMRENESYTFDVEGEKNLVVRVTEALEVGKPEITNPNNFGIASVSPNPFNNRARVSFDLASNGNVELNVIDMTGRSVMTLAKGDFTSGRHTVAFNGEALAGGTYIVRLESAGQISTSNMTLVK